MTAVPARVDRVGARGDGIARAEDGRTLFIPNTLPGERVRATPLARRGDGFAARLEEVVAPGPGRVAPACPHFGRCGGCRLQHFAPADYLNWKTGLLRDALAKAGFPDAPVTVVPGAPGQRRRADFALRRDARGTHVIGFHAIEGGIVDLAACPVLHPDLAALIPRLRTLPGLRGEGSAIVNLLDTGPDLLIRAETSPGTADRLRLTEFAHAAGLARLSWARGATAPEPVAILRPPVLILSGVPVSPPPGVFLQATAEGEAAIVAAVRGALPTLPRRALILELYAGIGTLTFALAADANVHAIEGAADAVAALRDAANRAMPGRVSVARADLARHSLAADLARARVVVLDPPAAGAAQIDAIAAVGKPVIYVSCDPVSLGRDAAALRRAGYAPRSATLIDQFLWSPRVEAVCAFDPPRQPARRL